jgi:hypothetical protein
MINRLENDNVVARELPSLALSSMPEEILCVIGSFLNVQSLSVCRQLNRRLCFLFSLNKIGWSQRCEELWARKVHIDSHAMTLRDTHYGPPAYQVSAMYGYLQSCEDARFRRSIRLEELCYNVNSRTGTIWNFRFKEAAGLEWTLLDPWYAGEDARQLIFLPCGAVKQVIQQNNVDNALSSSMQFMDPFFDSHPGGLEVRWKFITAPLDLPKGIQGTYLRLNVAGRDLPTYVVQRSPSGNWGFLLENCWGLFASFKLPRRRGSLTMPSTMRIITNMIETGRRRFNEISDEEIMGEEPARKLQRTSEVESNLFEDDSLSVTNDWQWREALLYNLGASSLPDGDSENADLHFGPTLIDEAED